MKYLFWAEYVDGDFLLEPFPNVASCERMNRWMERHGGDKVKSYGWTLDEDKVSVRIIKNKYKKAKQTVALSQH